MSTVQPIAFDLSELHKKIVFIIDELTKQDIVKITKLTVSINVNEDLMIYDIPITFFMD
jgi:hypothetical protein